MGRVEIEFHDFITSALDTGGCQVFIPDALLPRKEL
jgi:hypothetical protein